MKKASVLVVVSLLMLMAVGTVMATGDGGEADESNHAHPDGVENCLGHDGVIVGLIAGAIGIPVLVGIGYLYRRRQKKR